MNETGEYRQKAGNSLSNQPTRRNLYRVWQANQHEFYPLELRLQLVKCVNRRPVSYFAPLQRSHAVINGHVFDCQDKWIQMNLGTRRRACRTSHLDTKWVPFIAFCWVCVLCMAWFWNEMRWDSGIRFQYKKLASTRVPVMCRLDVVKLSMQLHCQSRTPVGSDCSCDTFHNFSKWVKLPKSLFFSFIHAKVEKLCLETCGINLSMLPILKSLIWLIKQNRRLYGDRKLCKARQRAWFCYP